MPRHALLPDGSRPTELAQLALTKSRQTPSSFGGLNVKLPTVAPGQSIGLLGGSFNPAHEGHLNISQAALKRLNLDRVWWLVSPGNPLKSRDELMPLSDRVDGARLLAKNRRIVVTDFERELPTPYTASTLAFLTTRLAQVNFVWLMGADNLAQIHLWKNWQAIFNLVPVAILDRPGFRHKARASRAAQRFASAFVDEADAAGLALMPAPAWSFLTVPLTSVSSTEIRRGPEQGQGEN